MGRRVTEADRTCTFCEKDFTAEEVRTGDRMTNERDQVMHTACYNHWCETNPFVQPEIITCLICSEVIPSNIVAANVHAVRHEPFPEFTDDCDFFDAHTEIERD